MKCDRVRLLLNAYVDGELDPASALDVEEHLRGCAACSEALRQLVSLQAATHSEGLYRAAPPQLEGRIRASLRKARPRGRG